jgi:hypothetical protein
METLNQAIRIESVMNVSDSGKVMYNGKNQRRFISRALWNKVESGMVALVTDELIGVVEKDENGENKLDDAGKPIPVRDETGAQKMQVRKDVVIFAGTKAEALAAYNQDKFLLVDAQLDFKAGIKERAEKFSVSVEELTAAI